MVSGHSTHQPSAINHQPARPPRRALDAQQTSSGIRFPYAGCDGLLRLKGSLHNHTVTSNGPITPPSEVRRLYQDAGYQFAAITDHDRRMHEVPWSHDDYNVSEPGVFALLRGYEASFPEDHVNCVGCLPRDAPIKSQDSRAGSVVVPEVARAPGEPGFVDEVTQTGALAWLNHPAKYNGCPERVLDDPELRLLHGLEVYSGARVAKAPGPIATDLWDACLARGLRLWALASPDCHNYDPELPDSPFNGYVVAFAAAVEPGAIMDALHAGRFYASTGVEVDRIRCTNGELRVHSTHAGRVRFIGARGLLEEAPGPSAAYSIAGDEGYVRVELVRDEPCFHTPDAPAQTAWLQPLWT